MVKKGIRIALAMVIIGSVLGLTISGCSQPPTPAPAPAPSTAPAPAPAPAPKPTPAPTPAPTQQKPITLKVYAQHPTTVDYYVEAEEYYPKLITQLSNGRVQFQIFPGEQLGKAATATSLITGGVADMGSINMNYEPSRFPLWGGVVNLPVEFKGYDGYLKGINKARDDIPELTKELDNNNVKWLTFWYTNLYNIWLNKKVSTVAELKGVKIRTPGGMMADIANAMGAATVTMASSETYMALKTGTIDGSFGPASTFVSQKVYEVAKYGFIGNFIPSAAFIAIDKNVWAKLPPDIQQIFMQAAVQLEDRYQKYRTKVEDQSILDAKNNGVTLIYPSDADKALIKEKLKTLMDKWIKDVGDVGQRIKKIRETYG